jgi:aminoglycoside phosphotransferase (APT) family kinase protein
VLATRTADGVARQVGSALTEDVRVVEHVPTGFGNENWRVTLSSGSRYVAKFGPRSSEAKWRSSQEAQQLAVSVGVPVARLVHFACSAEGILRIFEWVDGTSPADLENPKPDALRFFSELGDALGALHSIRAERFSSRLDGSAPSFDRWADYVAYRLVQIRARCQATAAFSDADLDRISGVIQREADNVSGAARPTLCHRDLHADNLVVSNDGALAAILDFDQSELWDATADWCKLEWMLFPRFSSTCREAFDVAYSSAHPENEFWAQRKHVVDLIELLNGVPNAIANSWKPFEIECRSRLAATLS